MTNDDLDPCEVCRVEKAETIPAKFDGVHQNCPRCGEFKISGSACAILHNPLGKQKRAILSGWVRQQNNLGTLPVMTSEILSAVLQRSLPPVAERAISLLQEASQGLSSLGATFNINESRFVSATTSCDQADVGFLVTALLDEGLIKSHGAGGVFVITPKGHMKIDEGRRRTANSEQGFVAMWFDENLADAYSEGFQLGILNAGYNPLRIDKHEHVNRIDDEIIRQINASRFVVADFTGHRGGVYFEAGYAMGINIPVFWTCHKSDMDKLHFDIRQFNCIDWETPNDLAVRLAARVEAVLGAGPNKFLNALG